MTKIMIPRDLSFFNDWDFTENFLNCPEAELDYFGHMGFAWFGWQNWREYHTSKEYLEVFWEYLESLGFKMVPEIGSTYSESLLVDAVKRAFIRYKYEKLKEI